MENFIERIVKRGRPYVIAEAGINHNGDLNLAKEMIASARESGADCIKFQSFITDKYISRKAGRASYQCREGFGDKSQYEIIKACELGEGQTKELKDYAGKTGIEFLSTPFELESFEMLMGLGVPAVKISSCNLTNYPFLNEVAKSKIPALVSTGMGSLAEVARAVDIFKRSGSALLLFQCTSNYPSKIENANLQVIPMFRQLFGVPIGFSDHTPGSTAAIGAVALGAAAIEKHFTLSRDLRGIDQKASIEPGELKELVISVSQCHAALGSSFKKRAPEEEDTRIALRRSLVAAKDISAGTMLTEDMVAVKRPGNGFSTEFLLYVIGKKIGAASEQG